MGIGITCPGRTFRAYQELPGPGVTPSQDQRQRYPSRLGARFGASAISTLPGWSPGTSPASTSTWAPLQIPSTGFPRSASAAMRSTAGSLAATAPARILS